LLSVDGIATGIGIMLRWTEKRIHFVGIGGIGMSGIAEVLLNLGYTITGSDISETEITKRLAQLGCIVSYRHQSDNVEGADVVVTSSAIRADNPEVQQAKALMIPVIPRAEMLAELMRMKYGVAIAGTHGKTTTASMIATVLAHGNLDPTMVIGGRVNSVGSNAQLGTGDFLVAEADESDGTFLKLSPTIAIVTNIDPEHLDHYGTMERLQSTFLEFVNKVPFYGASILCFDHKNVKALIPHLEKRYVTYGLSHGVNLRGADVTPKGWETTFKVYRDETPLGQMTLKMPGLHNVYNALASIACGLELEIDFRLIRASLEDFMGVQRRFQFKGEGNGIKVVDDYAHHPEELRCTLRAGKDVGMKRIVALFQPHRYTRTRDLFEDFLSVLDGADVLFVTDIYPAGEDQIPGVSAENLVDALRHYGHPAVEYVPDKDTLPEVVLPRLQPGDLVMTLGAGNIWQVAENIVGALSKKGS
jgi:UDP-N-acetylmuramate--alanine ligase